MTTTGRRTRELRSTRPTAGSCRRPAVAVLRSVLLATTVFALAALAGAVLSGAATAEPVTGTPTPGPRVAAVTAEHATAPEASGAADPVFTRSIVLSGAVALTVSVAGLVLVGRRRRLW